MEKENFDPRPTALSTHRAPAVRFYNMFRDGKSQPGASRFSRARGVNPVKPLKNPLLVRERYSNARIRNRHSRVVSPRQTLLILCALPAGVY